MENMCHWNLLTVSNSRLLLSWPTIHVFVSPQSRAWLRACMAQNVFLLRIFSHLHIVTVNFDLWHWCHNVIYIGSKWTTVANIYVKSFRSNATVRTDTYTQQSALPGPLKWSENIFKMENTEYSVYKNQSTTVWEIQLTYKRQWHFKHFS